MACVSGSCNPAGVAKWSERSGTERSKAEWNGAKAAEFFHCKCRITQIPMQTLDINSRLSIKSRLLTVIDFQSECEDDFADPRSPRSRGVQKHLTVLSLESGLLRFETHVWRFGSRLQLGKTSY